MVSPWVIASVIEAHQDNAAQNGNTQEQAGHLVKGRVLKDKRGRLTQGVGQQTWQDPLLLDQVDSECDRHGNEKQSG